ncbi:MAG: nucleotide sugar dehydrogenase [Microthrixaceae bacterium]
MDICVVALGKIGLPLAVQYASMGHRVRGADINRELVDCINRGEEPFPGEADLAERLSTVVRDGSLTAGTDTTAAVADSDIVVVVVPLVVDSNAEPDYTAMDAATESIGKGIKPGTLVIYETTLPVGTTRERFTPRLAELSGTTPGEDLMVCFSPERVYSGRIFADLSKYPKIVGGIDDRSAAAAIAFYESVLSFDDRDDLDRPNGVWDVGTAEAAELVKLAETTYRDVNIGLANEFARYARSNGIDIHSVIEAANSQPFSHLHQPGISVGGHCIPVYPRLYLSNDPGALLPAASRTTNERMPAWFADMLRAAMGGSLEGAAYSSPGSHTGEVSRNPPSRARTPSWQPSRPWEPAWASTTLCSPMRSSPRRVSNPHNRALVGRRWCSTRTTPSTSSGHRRTCPMHRSWWTDGASSIHRPGRRRDAAT